MQIHCLLSHFECDGYTVHMLTQWHVPPPLTSTVKLSLFTHAHSSPLFLAARLHQCCILIILTMAGLFPDRLRKPEVEHSHKALNKVEITEYLTVCVEESSRSGSFALWITKKNVLFMG